MAKHEVKVKEYKNPKDYEKDASKMLKDGWVIAGQSEHGTHVNVARTILKSVGTLGLNWLTPKIGGASYTKGKITITWTRDR